MPENDHAPTETGVYADDHPPAPVDVSAFVADEDDDPQAHMGEEVIG